MAEDRVFDMEEIRIQVGNETAAYDSDAQDVNQSPKDGGNGIEIILVINPPRLERR